MKRDFGRWVPPKVFIEVQQWHKDKCATISRGMKTAFFEDKNYSTYGMKTASIWRPTEACVLYQLNLFLKIATESKVLAWNIFCTTKYAQLEYILKTSGANINANHNQPLSPTTGGAEGGSHLKFENIPCAGW